MLRCQAGPTAAALLRSNCRTGRRLAQRPPARRTVRCHTSGSSASGSSAAEEVAAYVEGVTVSPFFRSVPDTSGGESDRAAKHVKVLLLSESNVCRSVLAEAMLRRALLSHPTLEGRVQVASKAVKVRSSVET